MSDTRPEFRLPWKIERTDLPECPPLRLVDGAGGPIIHSAAYDDGRYFRQGIVHQSADHDPFEWDQMAEETHYCLSGRIVITATDSQGGEAVVTASPGDYLYLPGGLHYRLDPSGQPTSFFWTTFVGNDTSSLATDPSAAKARAMGPQGPSAGSTR